MRCCKCVKQTYSSCSVILALQCLHSGLLVSFSPRDGVMLWLCWSEHVSLTWFVHCKLCNIDELRFPAAVGLDSAELISQLRAAHAEEDTRMGVDVVLGKAGDMSELGIYECYRVRLQFLICLLSNHGKLPGNNCTLAFPGIPFHRMHSFAGGAVLCVYGQFLQPLCDKIIIV